MQHIFDPISKNLTIIEGNDVVVLTGPFASRAEAIQADKANLNKIKSVGSEETRPLKENSND